MTEIFKQTILSYPYPLFYNSTGSPVAYKLAIRHLSASSFSGLASLASGYIYPHDVLYLVNLEEEKIEKITERIKLIPLKSLK